MTTATHANAPSVSGFSKTKPTVASSERAARAAQEAAATSTEQPSSAKPPPTTPSDTTTTTSAATSPAGRGSSSGSSRHAPDKDAATLAFQNERLRDALKTSSENKQEWERELQTVRNTNARLTTALQDSFKNMEEWKKQLAMWQEESAKAKARVAAIEEESRTKESGNLAREQELEEAVAKHSILADKAKREAASATQEVEALRSENKDLAARVDALEQEVQALGQAAAFKKKYETQHQLLSSWQDKLSNKIAELDDLNTALTDIADHK